MTLEAKRILAKKFFSVPRNIVECRNIIMICGGIMPDDINDQQAVENAVADIFQEEMISLNLFFKRA